MQYLRSDLQLKDDEIQYKNQQLSDLEHQLRIYQAHKMQSYVSMSDLMYISLHNILIEIDSDSRWKDELHKLKIGLSVFNRLYI